MADNIATIGIAMETAQLKKGISELGKLGEAGKKAEKQLSTSFMSVDKEIQKFNESMAKHGRTIDANGNVLNKNGEILKTTTSTYKNLTNAVADFNAQIKAVAPSVKNAEIELARSESIAKMMGSTLVGTSKTIDGLGLSLDKISGKLTQSQNAMKHFIAEQVDMGRTIDANGNIFSSQGVKLTTLSNKYKELQSNLTSHANAQDAVDDAMRQALMLTDKNQAELQKYAKAQQEAAERVSRLDNAIDNQNKAATKAQKVMSGLSDEAMHQAKNQGKLARVMGQSGVQLEQFMGQVASGTPLLRALGYQATDLGIVLSGLIPSAAAVGAAIGIGSAALSMLLPQLLKSTELVSDFKFEIDELKDSLNDLSKLSKAQLAVGLIDTSKRMDELSKEAEKQRKVIAELNKELDVGSKFRTVKTTFGAPITVTTEITAEERKKLEEQLEREKATFDSINQEYKKQSDLLTELSNITNQITKSGKDKDKLSKEQRQNLDELNKALSNQIDILNGVEGAERAAMIEQTKAQLGVEELDKTTLGYIDTLFELKEAQELGNLTESLDKQIAALELQTIEMKKGKAAAIEFAIAQQIAAAGGEVTPELQAKIDKIRELTGALEGLKGAEKAQADFDRLSDSIMNVGNGFSSTGDVIVDTFGNMAQALDNYLGKMGELDKWQEQLNDSKKENIDVSAEQQKLDELRFKTEIQGYAAGAKAAASFFDEKTAAHKAFTAAERALTAIEIGLALKQTAVDVAAGAAKIFNQTGVLGFAGVAAMVGVMAGLGFAGGSGGGYTPPDNDFSGTALGTSEASESLSESINIQSDMLAELVDLNSNFILLANLTGGLSSTVARLEGVDTGSLGTFVTDTAKVTGGIGALNSSVLTLGIGGEIQKAIGSVKKTVQAAGIEVFSQSLEGVIDGLTIDAKQFADVRRKEKALGVKISDKTKTTYDDLSNDAQRQIALVFSEIANTFESSAKILGVDVSGFIDTFIIEGFKIDLKDLEGDEIQEKLNEMFSKFADDLSQPLEGVFGKYQQVGEGMFETVNRLAIEQARFNEVARLTGIELSHAFDVDTAQNVITMAGGISELASSANDFAKEFLPVSQQIQLESEKLNDILAAMGVDQFSATRQGFVDLIQSLDVTTESGATLYAQLLQLADPLSDLIDKEEKLNNQRTGLQIELLDALGREEEALAMRRSLELEAIDETLHALQLQVWAEEDRAKAIEETSNKLRPFIDSINNALGINLVTLDQALSAARSGNFDKATKLDVNAVLNQSADKFSSRADMLVSDAINKGKLLEIAKLAENELSAVDKQTMSLVSIDSNMQKLVNIATNGQTDTYIPRVVTPNNSIEPVMIQIRDMQDKMNNYMLQMVKNTMETANNTDKLYRDGVTIVGGV